MRNLKTFALAAVAAGALMAFIGAGTASATELCSTTTAAGVACPTGQKVTGVISFSLATGTKAVWKETSAPGGEGKTIDECGSSEDEGEITNSGSSTTTVTGGLSKQSWGSCTFPTSTTALGKIEIHKIAGTSNGTLTADTAIKETINTIFFGTCVYAVTAGASIGDLTEGNPAVFHANAVVHKQEGSAFACPETLLWIATYTMTKPATTVSVS
jgi:hypothetical protein